MRTRSSALIQDGFNDKLLLSQDVFLEMMLTRYGGHGYGHILRNFVPRSVERGLAREEIRHLLV
jgi:phosphotriesterase-related protein